MTFVALLLRVFALIALGLALRASGFLPAEFWRGAERLTYFVGFPALLFREAARASPGGLPLVAGLLCVGLGLSGTPAVVLTTYAGVPASPSSYVLARELGGDAALMANLITAHTVAAALPWPLVIWLAPR
jgi:predicted permease